MRNVLSRRNLLIAGSAAVAGGLARADAAAEIGAEAAPADTFRYCLNTSTISGQRLSLPEEVDLAASAGYSGIEPWAREIEVFAQKGGSLADLRKRIEDRGLVVQNAIGFARWIVDDPAERAKGLEQAKREMELVSRIGGKRVAAAPAGVTNITNFDLLKGAERYRALADAAAQMGIVPQVEIWGGSKTLSKLGEAMLVAAESGFAGACVLPDVFHMYKAGSSFSGLRMLNAQSLQMIHLNDYPAEPPREKIGDQQRIFPGDGIAPLREILSYVRTANPRCVVSLELFNREYYKRDAMTVAKMGLEKMKAAVAKSAGAPHG